MIIYILTSTIFHDTNMCKQCVCTYYVISHYKILIDYLKDNLYDRTRCIAIETMNAIREFWRFQMLNFLYGRSQVP